LKQRSKGFDVWAYPVLGETAVAMLAEDFKARGTLNREACGNTFA